MAHPPLALATPSRPPRSGNELTKESHVGGQASGEEVGGSTGGDSSYSRRSRFLHDISASFDPANAIKPPPLAMTSTDGKRIIGTKEAMKTSRRLTRSNPLPHTLERG